MARHGIDDWRLPWKGMAFALFLAGLAWGTEWAITPSRNLEIEATRSHWTAEQGPPAPREISYTEGLELLKKKGAVDAVEYEVSDLHPTRRLTLTLSDGAVRWFNGLPTPPLEDAVVASGAKVTMVNANAASVINLVLSMGTSLVVLVLMGFLVFGWVRKFLTSPARIVRPGKNPVRFADIAGQDEAKASLQEIIATMREPARFASVGARTPAGALMVGPPGTGKTLLAKATAAEAGVPFLYVAGSDFLELFAGLGARRVRATWKLARRQQRGCIIFIDEIETMAAARSGNSSDVGAERDQTVAAMLTELDGLESRKGVVLIAATNRPELLDPAFVRPGRIDRRIEVTSPDAKGRSDILETHCRKLPMDPAADPRSIAASMPGASGADLANLANEAALRAAAKGFTRITQENLIEARDTILMGSPQEGMDIHPEDEELAAWHEGGHALVATVHPDCEPIHAATIVPRKRARGMVVQLPARDRAALDRLQIAARLAVYAAGREAERIKRGEDRITSGAMEDIRAATREARIAIAQWGFHRNLAPLDWLGDANNQPSQNAIERVERTIGEVVEICALNARTILLAYPEAHAAIAAALLKRRTLTGDEVTAIVAENPSTVKVRHEDPWGKQHEKAAEMA